MKSLTKLSMVRSLWLVIGFLAGVALTATADSRLGPESGGHDVTLARTTTTTAQISPGNCLASSCLTNAFVTLSRLDGSPVSSGIRTLAPSGGGAPNPSNIGRFKGSLTGPITLQDGVDRVDRIPSNFVLALANVSPQPQLHLTAATTTRGIGSPYLQGSGGGVGSMIRQLFCSSPVREDCVSDNLFNSNPTIKSAPTAKVILAPEPTAAFLLGTALLALGLIRRRQKTGRT